MKKNSSLVTIVLFMLLMISCTTKQSLDSNESEQQTNFSDIYRNITTNFKTYFDLVNNEISKTKDPSKFKLHLICPKTWEGDNGIYIKDEKVAMLVTQTVREININNELDDDSYKYFQRGDPYDYSDKKCLISETNKGIPYVFYMDESYVGMIVIKFEDKYIFNITILEPINAKTFNDILNSIKLEHN